MSAFASRVYVYARGTYVRPVAIESRSIPSIFASHGLSTAGEGKENDEGAGKKGKGGGDLSKNNQSFVAFVEIRARKRLSFGGGKKIISQEFLRKTTPPNASLFAFIRVRRVNAELMSSSSQRSNKISPRFSSPPLSLSLSLPVFFLFHSEDLSEAIRFSLRSEIISATRRALRNIEIRAHRNIVLMQFLRQRNLCISGTCLIARSENP